MAAVTYQHPEALASSQWLADHLEDPLVRVVDARFDLRATSEGVLEAVAERDAYSEAHIPGAVFIDVMGDLADPEDPVVVVPPDRFEALMDHHKCLTPTPVRNGGGKVCRPTGRSTR